MNKKISFVMLFALSLSITQQFFASVQNKDVEARVQAFREEQKREQKRAEQKIIEDIRKKYTQATENLVELTALQKILDENEIKKVGHLRLSFDSIQIGRSNVGLAFNLALRIQHILNEQKREVTCGCMTNSYSRYDEDCDLSIVFARVQHDLEANRKHYEDLLSSQSNNQSNNSQSA